MENGDLSDCQEYSAPYRSAKNGRAIAYALAYEPDATLNVEAEGLPGNDRLDVNAGIRQKDKKALLCRKGFLFVQNLHSS
jgi:hypothetical protein